MAEPYIVDHCGSLWPLIDDWFAGTTFSPICGWFSLKVRGDTPCVKHLVKPYIVNQEERAVSNFETSPALFFSILWGHSWMGVAGLTHHESLGVGIPGM